MDENTVTISEFKAKCLQLIDEVERTRVPLTISKRGRPVARVVATEPEQRRSLYGSMKGTVTVLTEIVSPIAENWDADG